MTGEVAYPRYRWFILLMGWAILCLTSYNQMMLAVRYDILLPVAQGGLGLTTTQFYLCITGTSIAPIVIALVSGLLTDRIGVKRVILYGAIITVIGALLRVAATGFIDLFIYCIIMGVGLGTAGGNVPKLVGQWFHIRQIYLAIALFSTSLGIGPLLGLATGALFPNYSMGFLVMGLALAVMCVVWGIWAKDRPREYMEDGRPIVGVPFRESLVIALKSKYIWMITLSYALVLGVMVGVSGGMPLVLVEAKGVAGETAGFATALFVFGYIPGIVFWSWAAEKAGYMRPFYAICMFLTGLTGWLMYIGAPGIGMFVFAPISGFFIGAGIPLVMQMPLRLKGIGTRYAGVAMGLIASGGNLMAVIMLPLIFTPIWEAFDALWAVFFFFMCLTAGGLLFIMAPEVGRKYMERVLREAMERAAHPSS